VPKARLVERLGVAPSTLNYHLKHLVAQGLLTHGRDGREAIYESAAQDAVVRLLVAYRTTLLDRMVDGFLEGIDALR
jgi:predicted transcriptional regulator